MVFMGITEQSRRRPADRSLQRERRRRTAAYSVVTGEPGSGRTLQRGRPGTSLYEADGIPKIYIMSFAPTATIAYGKYAMNVFRGAYKKIGIPARTGLTSVVTRLSTEEQRSRTDASVSWLAIKFEAMGVFNPEDYTTK